MIALSDTPDVCLESDELDRWHDYPGFEILTDLQTEIKEMKIAMGTAWSA